MVLKFFIPYQLRSIKIYCDNSVAIFFSKSNKYGNPNKHIDIKYLIMREKMKEYEVLIEHISIELMIVNLVTKALPTKQ